MRQSADRHGIASQCPERFLRGSKAMKFALIDRYRGLLPRVHLCRPLAATDRGLRTWRGPLPGSRLTVNACIHLTANGLQGNR